MAQNGRRTVARGAGGRGAFSLIEALVALSITALAGSVLLLAVDSSLSTSQEAVEKTIADGLAQQRLDEILTKRYVEPGTDPLSPTLEATAWELLGAGTERFNDVDDFHNNSTSPPKDMWGTMLGTGDDLGGLRLSTFRLRSDYFQGWRRRTLVYYVHPNDHTVTSSSPTAFRAIEVFVERVEANGAVRPLATRKRVIAYFPATT